MAKKGGNPENLNPVRTKNEARKRGENGGKKSGEVRAKNKTIRDALKAALEGSFAVGDKMLKGYDAIALKAVMEALSGNVQALNFVRDTIGEKPMDKVDVDIKSNEAQREVRELLQAIKDEKV